MPFQSCAAAHIAGRYSSPQLAAQALAFSLEPHLRNFHRYPNEQQNEDAVYDFKEFFDFIARMSIALISIQIIHCFCKFLISLCSYTNRGCRRSNASFGNIGFFHWPILTDLQLTHATNSDPGRSIRDPDNYPTLDLFWLCSSIFTRPLPLLMKIERFRCRFPRRIKVWTVLFLGTSF